MKQFEYCYFIEWSGLPKEIIFSSGQHKDVRNMKRVDIFKHFRKWRGKWWEQ